MYHIEDIIRSSPLLFVPILARVSNIRTTANVLKSSIFYNCLDYEKLVTKAKNEYRFLNFDFVKIRVHS